MKTIISLFALPLLLLSCAAEETSAPKTFAKSVSLSSNPFSEYWFDGQAELNSYSLEQARYGEVHQGEAVMIFVTEPFSKSKQVKLDNGSTAGKDKSDVLKLNFTKKFFTGIYPYSMMMSTFKPIDQAKVQRPLKVSTTSQEWCGHTFTQYNLQGNKYMIQQYSYFESEGDEKVALNAVFLEDEIWSQIRMNPDLLPTGKFKIMPGSLYSRMSHGPLAPVNATAEIAAGPAGLSQYKIAFEDGRKLVINYNTQFPFTIESWTESLRSGYGDGAKELTTIATLKKRIKLDYWNKNGLEDAGYREQLELTAW